MEFRETLLAAQKNQRQKSSAERTYYKARFDPPKKEHKPRDRLSANIQKFLAKKEEEERERKLEAQRKRDELLAMRDPKALRKIQKTLKVIKSANKSVLADAIDTEHTAVTREGPDQPDQDDYGYESQEAAALYEKMMQKYSKIPDEPKFAPGGKKVNKDLKSTRERVIHALLHEDDPVPHKRRRHNEHGNSSPPEKYEPEKKKDEKSEKPKIRKPAPPPLDFNQLLKIAEQKKSEPIEVAAKKVVSEPEPDRLMTKKQKMEYEQEMARKQRRQERIDAEKAGRKVTSKEKRPTEKIKKPEAPSSMGRIPKLGDKSSANHKSEIPKSNEKERERAAIDREKLDKLQREREKIKLEKEKSEREKERLEKERLKLAAERERIDREIERLNRLNKDIEKVDKTKTKLANKTMEKQKLDKAVDRQKMSSREQETKKNIDLKTQNTYRIDKNSNERKLLAQKSNEQKYVNGHSSQKPVSKLDKSSINRSDSRDRLMKERSTSDVAKSNGHMKDKRPLPVKNGQKHPDERRPQLNTKLSASSSKPVPKTFDFDKHVNSLGKNGSKQFPPSNVRRKPHPDDKKKIKRRMVASDSEYDSEMDDFIDDGDENLDYSSAIKEIFGYDKSKYRDMDDDDDPMMESTFAQQQREEYISKKIGIEEDLEDIRMERMEKLKKKKSRRISDDD